MSDGVGGRLALLQRHWTVLRESWSLQKQLDRQKHTSSDHAFLPAALEIIEQPPSPAWRAMLLSICSFFALTLLWSCLASIDVIAVASGKLIPSARVKVIQSIETAAVRAIHVANGQHVEEGALLIEFDPTLADAELAQAQKVLLGAEVLKARHAALIDYLEGGRHGFLAPPGSDHATRLAEAAYHRVTVAEFEAQTASLRHQMSQRISEMTASQAEVVKLERTLPLVEQQLEARRELTRQGNFALLKLLEYEQVKIEHLQNMEVQQANVEKARASVTALQAEIIKLRESFGKTVTSDYLQASDKVQIASEDLRKAVRRRELQQLRAPVGGTVQQLSLATIGGVVQPAQVLMMIVPDGYELEVDAQIPNKDIGFVREGQPVRIKLEAFPFTDYGLLPGEVASISRDAIDLSQPAAPLRDDKGRPAQTGLVYAARIRLLDHRLSFGSNDVQIGPGLAVQAEIRTGERRIIQYLLSPLTRSLDEAARER